jgi:hypothetical protein
VDAAALGFHVDDPAQFHDETVLEFAEQEPTLSKFERLTAVLDQPANRVAWCARDL